MREEQIKAVVKDELYGQYNWFYVNFLPAVQQACDEFYSNLFTFKLTSVSKNTNILAQGDDYFVTKIKVDQQYEVFFRTAEDAIKIIMEEVLGSGKQEFDLSKITELEAKIISSFNDYLYNAISPILSHPPISNKPRKNFDTIYLTFFIQNNKTLEGGKLIIAVPQILLSPSVVQPTEEKFDVSAFKTSKIDVNIKVGTTKFQVKALKHLEKDDIVIFENSNIQTMQVIYKDYKNNFRITPNPGLIITLDNSDGGHQMEENSLSQNLWDNIQVEMGAEFDTVKISLGELKNIEQGLVVDIASVYNNKISLKVENKIIASGELVIINDRYGVRIDEVFASENSPTPAFSQPNTEVEETEHVYHEEPNTVEEEFDYSDFELDDQDI
jgi:flagellar motor switch protein FliN/FliY